MTRIKQATPGDGGANLDVYSLVVVVVEEGGIVVVDVGEGVVLVGVAVVQGNV